MVGGEPATGKTHLVRALVSLLRFRGVRLDPSLSLSFPALVDPQRRTAVLGRYVEGDVFAGTDRLSMSAQPKVLAAIRSLDDGWRVLFEGDRLCNASFMDACVRMGRPARLFLLTVGSPQILRERHVQRGDKQGETFLKGRATKWRNLEGRAAAVLRHSCAEDTARAMDRLLEELGYCPAGCGCTLLGSPYTPCRGDGCECPRHPKTKER